jgi:hypothetical protein
MSITRIALNNISSMVAIRYAMCPYVTLPTGK